MMVLFKVLNGITVSKTYQDFCAILIKRLNSSSSISSILLQVKIKTNNI